MMPFDRREFLKISGAGAAALAAPLALSQKTPLPPIKSTFNGVVVGCNTYSFSQSTLDEAVKNVASLGFGEAELHPRHGEPSFGTPFRPLDAVLTPDERKTMAANREKLRQWRLNEPLETFAAMGKKFKDAGLYLLAYNMNFRDDMSDAEVERIFEMTKAMGCNLMTAVGSNMLFRRLDPFAKKHKVRVGLHNEGNLRSEKAYDEVRKGLSEWIAITFDIGHWEAYATENPDHVGFIKKYHNDIVNIHIKDRKRGDKGANMPFGEGDTPIKEVLALLKRERYPIRAFVEYEYAGLRGSQEEVKRCVEYMRAALA